MNGLLFHTNINSRLSHHLHAFNDHLDHFLQINPFHISILMPPIIRVCQKSCTTQYLLFSMNHQNSSIQPSTRPHHIYNRTLIQLKHSLSSATKNIVQDNVHFPTNQRGCIKNPVSKLVVVLLLLLIYSEALWDNSLTYFLCFTNMRKGLAIKSSFEINGQ